IFSKVYVSAESLNPRLSQAESYYTDSDGCYYGNLYLNSTPATKFYFDTDLFEIKDFTNSCYHWQSEHVHFQLQQAGTQEADFYVKLGLLGSSNKMAGFLSHALDATGSWRNVKFTSVRTIVLLLTSLVLSGMAKIAQHLDGKAYEQEADVLAFEEISNGGEEVLPSCLEELAGKEFVFQIRVTLYNFTLTHRTFTVPTITEDLIVDNQPEVGLY
ncbi:hypothetical protein HID58_022841, partial [Brassica napus]